jgi:lipopolysaccharide transport system permease protein
LNVRYRDINFFTQALLVIWFYATPILYPVSLLPPGLEWVLNLNPLSSIVEMGHLAFLGSGELDLVRATFNLVVGGVLLTGGVVIFNKFKNMFVDWY